MSKNKKKRNKKYTGIDAKIDDGLVTIRKVTAANRTPFHQWLFEKKKIIRIVAIALLAIAVITAALVSFLTPS